MMEITRKGDVLHLEGHQLDVGARLPEVTLHNLDNQAIKLTQYDGKVMLLSIVPDIDTRVCSIQTKRFNQEVGELPGVQLITISNNTREEQANWCAAEGVEMELLHDTDLIFGQAFGLVIQELNRLARAIVVIDQTGHIIYQEIVAELSDEPNYQLAFKAAKEAVHQQ